MADSLDALRARANKPISPWGTDGGEAEKIYRQRAYIEALEAENERLRAELVAARCGCDNGQVTAYEHRYDAATNRTRRILVGSTPCPACAGLREARSKGEG